MYAVVSAVDVPLADAWSKAIRSPRESALFRTEQTIELPKEATLNELVFPREFARIAELHGSRRASLDLGDGSKRTHSEHRDRVLKLADAMRRHLGLTQTDRYGVLLENRPEYGELWHAGLCGGGIINALNSRAHADDIAFMLKDSEASVLFVDDKHAGVVAAIRSRLPHLRTVVAVGDTEAPVDAYYDDLLAAGSAQDWPTEPEEDSTALLMYTGGTTGKPKGVILTQRAVMLNWHRTSEAIRPTEDWAILQCVPMFHVGSFVSVTMTHLSGGALAYLPQWDPGFALESIDRYGLTAFGAVPAMAVQLIEHPAFSPSRIRTLEYFGYGAAPISEGLLRRLIAALPDRKSVV